MKLVVVMRKDLNMRKGKMCAQFGHAVQLIIERLMFQDPERYRAWARTYNMAKICVGVETERDLFELQKKALDLRIPNAVVLDAGKTEFNEPTYTCLAVGPDENTKIDMVTGALKLL